MATENQEENIFAKFYPDVGSASSEPKGEEENIFAKFYPGPPKEQVAPSEEALNKDVGFGEKALNTAEAIGTGLKSLPTHAKGYVANVIEGSHPLDSENFLDKWAQESQQLSEQQAKSEDANDPTLLGTKQDWQSTFQSIPFSAGSMLGAVGGGIAGSLAGGGVNPVTGYAGQAAGAAIPAYRADSAMFMRDALSKFTQDYAAKNNGKAPSREELLAEQERLQPFATKHGLAEAGFEAIGTPIANKLLGGIFKPGGNLLAKTGKAMAGILAEEIPTETGTQLVQHNAEVEAGLSQDKERSFLSPEDIYTSGKEVAIPVIQQSLLLGGAGGAVKAGYDRYQKYRQGQEQTPPDSAQAPQAESQEPQEEGTPPPQAGPEISDRVKVFVDRAIQKYPNGWPEQAKSQNLANAGKEIGVYQEGDENNPSVLWSKVKNYVYPPVEKSPEEQLQETADTAKKEGLDVLEEAPTKGVAVRAAKTAYDNNEAGDVKQKVAEKAQELENASTPKEVAPEEQIAPTEELPALRTTPEELGLLNTFLEDMTTRGTGRLPYKTTPADIADIGSRLGVPPKENQSPVDYAQELFPLVEQERKAHAFQQQISGAPDVSGSAQPQIREDRGNTGIGGPGVLQGGQTEGNLQPETSETPIPQTGLTSEQSENTAPEERPQEAAREAVKLSPEQLQDARDTIGRLHEALAKKGSAGFTTMPRKLREVAQTLDVYDAELTPNDLLATVDARLQQPQASIPEPTPETPIDFAAHSQAAASPLNDIQEAEQPKDNRKAFVNFQDLPIEIENPAGTQRSGTDENGKPWSITMRDHYGAFTGVKGADKDHLDVFIPEGLTRQQIEATDKAYVVDQINPKTGQFDEHKTILAAPNEAAARETYLRNYEPGWQGLGAITEMPMRQFKDWLQNGDKTKPVSPQAERAAPSKETGPRNLEAIFSDLDPLSGKAKQTAAQAEIAAHPLADRIQYIQDNFLDLLYELDNSGRVKIQC